MISTTSLEIVISKLWIKVLRCLELEAFWVSWACGWDPEEVVRAIDCGLNPDAADLSGRSLTYNAIARGKINTVKVLIAHGANPNIKDSLGRTPLFGAVEIGNGEGVRVLCEAGAEVDYEDRGGFSPLGWCVIVGVEACKKQKWRLREGVESCIAILIANGASPNIFTSNDNSPLMLAAFNKDDRLFEVLCKNGGNPSLANRHGDSPLSMLKREARQKRETFEE